MLDKVEFTVTLTVWDSQEPHETAVLLMRLLEETRAHEPKVRLSDNEAVKAFHKKFEVPMSPTPSLPSQEVFDFRSKFLQEELDEFNEAYQEQNLHKMADALIDLVYVAQGTALMMGLPWSLLWEEVQRANMSKMRAINADHSKRKTSLDVVKPEGWRGPDFTHILGEA